MCMGIPMKVREVGFGYAVCDDRGAERIIDTMLVGEVKQDDWLLVFIDAAREVIAEEDALKIRDALKAVQLAMIGDGNLDHLFADLTDVAPAQSDK